MCPINPKATTKKQQRITANMLTNELKWIPEKYSVNSKEGRKIRVKEQRKQIAIC